MTDYTELKCAAEAAPSGPWVAENDSLYFKYDGYTRHLMDADAGHDVEDEAYYLALNFIAAANPAAVLALIAENERLERNRDMWKGQVDRQCETIEGLRKALKTAEDAMWHADGNMDGEAADARDALAALGQGEQS